MIFWAITLVPDTLEGQARALSTWEILQFPTEVSAKISAHWIGVQGRSKLVKKTKTPQFASQSQANPSPKSKHFFYRTKKTCCIRRGFEQLSSYSGWRVITKKPSTNLLARAVVKGFYIKVPTCFCSCV